MGLVVGQRVIRRYLKDRVNKYSRRGPLQLDLISSYHGQEISDEIWTWIEFNV